LAPGIIVDPGQRRLYAVSPDGGIKAVDVRTGGEVWTSKAAAKPIGLVAGKLIGQVEGAKATNLLEVAALDAATGRRLASGSAELPAQIQATVAPTANTKFSVTAEGLPSGDAVISWEFDKQMARPVPPGRWRAVPRVR
jgi:hypothetical protein